MNALYYIIDIHASRQAGQLQLRGRGTRPVAAGTDKALVVSESHLIAQLERYDNGATTRAILCEALESFQGHWRTLINPSLHTRIQPSNQGASA